MAEERAKYNALLAEIENAVAPLNALYEKVFNGGTPGNVKYKLKLCPGLSHEIAIDRFPRGDALEKEVTVAEESIEV